MSFVNDRVSIPKDILDKACSRVERAYKNQLPFNYKGIKIKRELIKATLKILNSAPNRELPQNCRKDKREHTPEGLDKKIKEELDDDIMTATFISDVLERCNIVKVTKVKKHDTGNWVKGTKLLPDWSWDPALSDSRDDKSTIILNRNDFLENDHVSSFIKWVISKLDGEQSLIHEFTLKKQRKHWRCTSLYEAFKAYEWKFNFYCPVKGRKISGYTVEETIDYLSSIAVTFRKGIKENNEDLVKRCCESVLTWGGVKAKNIDKINAMDDVCGYFKDTQSQLDMTIDEIKIDRQVIMNSGFTKLYSLVSDDFIMYDGRVGAALGLLIKDYCMESDLEQVPEELSFGYLRGRETNPKGKSRRNPSFGKYGFKEISGNREKHLIDNIKASWLLKEIIRQSNSKFSYLPQFNPLDQRLVGLQSALFMIGYDVSRRG